MSGEELLDEDRADLARRMAELNPGVGDAAGWTDELHALESRGYTVAEATIEYYVDCAADAGRVPLLSESVYCYLQSLLAVRWQFSLDGEPYGD